MSVCHRDKSITFLQKYEFTQPILTDIHSIQHMTGHKQAKVKQPKAREKQQDFKLSSIVKWEAEKGV